MAVATQLSSPRHVQALGLGSFQLEAPLGWELGLPLPLRLATWATPGCLASVAAQKTLPGRRKGMLLRHLSQHPHSVSLLDPTLPRLSGTPGSFPFQERGKQ